MDKSNLTEDVIAKIVKNREISKYKHYEDYYDGEHDILLREFEDTSKPNNKLIHSYGSYIVDVVAGYMFGIPVMYSGDDRIVEKVKDIYDYNDEQENNSEIAVNMGTLGHDFELIYIDADGQFRFSRVGANEMTVIYSLDIVPEIIGAVRYYTFDNEIIESEKGKVHFYSDESEKIYDWDVASNRLTLIEEKTHYFGMVPVVEYMGNSKRFPLFKKVISLIDAYDNAESDTANDVESFTDAYLVFAGALGTKSEDVTKMKENRVILLPEGASANFLTKVTNDTVTENFKNRLAEDIHRFSRVPNLTDESFAGNLSGVALKYKLWGLETLSAGIERLFKKSLQRRMEILSVYMNIIGMPFDWRSIKLTFTRNIPSNILELADVAVKLKNIVSDETLLEHIPYVDDVEQEMERMKEQKDGSVELAGYDNTNE